MTVLYFSTCGNDTSEWANNVQEHSCPNNLRLFRQVKEMADF